jgi:integrase
MEFSIRRDPGIPLLQWARGGPSVQIAIDTGPKTLTLNANEDGLFVRAIGPSLVDPTHRAIYTVTLDWHSLRHSCASFLATDAALPPTTLARVTGHSDAGFTLRAYARDARDKAVVKDVIARAARVGVGT